MNVEIADRLAGRRKEAGLSQEALAEKLGVSRQAVSKWERSESSPDTDNLIALAKLYGVSLDDLLYVDNDIEDDVEFEAADRAAQRKAEESVQGSTSAQRSTAVQESAPTQESSHETAGTYEDAPSTPDWTVKDTSSNKKAEDYVHFGGDGIHVESDDDSVHITWRDGVHVNSKDGESVHVGWDGVHVNDPNYKEGQYDHHRAASGYFADNEGNTFTWNKNGVIINGEHFDNWQEANKKYGHWPFVGTMSRKKHWMVFPFWLVAILAYLIIGFSTNEWAYGLFVFFTVPVYYMIGSAISERRIAPFLAGFYPLAVSVWFLWVGFMYGMWHPAWIAFLTIPIWEWIVHAISGAAQKRRAKKNEPIDVDFDAK